MDSQHKPRFPSQGERQRVPPVAPGQKKLSEGVFVRTPVNTPLTKIVLSKPDSQESSAFPPPNLENKLNEAELDGARLCSSVSRSQHAARGAKEITARRHLASSARGGRIPRAK